MVDPGLPSMTRAVRVTVNSVIKIDRNPVGPNSPVTGADKIMGVELPRVEVAHTGVGVLTANFR